MFTKQTKTQVIAEVRRVGKWHGWVVGCNVNTYHIKSGWNLGFEIELFWDNDRGVCVVGQETCELDPNAAESWRHAHFPRTFQDFLDNWAWYNANSETGNYAAYYRED